MLQGPWTLGLGTSVCFPDLLLTDLVTSVESRTQSKPSSQMLGVAVVVPVMSNSGNTGLRALEKVRICEEPCPVVPYHLRRAVVPSCLRGEALSSVHLWK